MSTGRLPIGASSATRCTIEGRELVLFAGCDYLGLAHHPEVVAALQQGAREHGVSAGGSRETTGNRAVHEELEHELARFLGQEAALLAPDGYLANLIAAQEYAGEVSLALVDREAHVSLRDALAATGMRVREFADLPQARVIARTNATERLALLTDGVFPAAGRIAPLRELLELAGAEGTLVVDDCHGLGVLGAHGRGTLEHFGLADPRIVLVGTLSKALGCHGGFVAGTRARIERVRERSRAYVGSTPIPPALACAARAALAVLAREPQRLHALRANIEHVRAGLRRLGFVVHNQPLPVFALQPGDLARMRALHEQLLACGLLVPLVEYPDALGDYLRLAVSSAHTAEDLGRLFEALAPAKEKAR